MLMPTGIYVQPGHPAFVQMPAHAAMYQAPVTYNYMHARGAAAPLVTGYRAYLPSQLQHTMIQQQHSMFIHPGAPHIHPSPQLVQPHYVYYEHPGGNLGAQVTMFTYSIRCHFLKKNK